LLQVSAAYYNHGAPAFFSARPYSIHPPVISYNGHSIRTGIESQYMISWPSPALRPACSPATLPRIVARITSSTAA